jgi:hypothetical protein
MTTPVLHPSRLGGLGPQAGFVAVLAALWVLFSAKSPGFISSFNLFNLGRTLAIDILIGFSQMVVLAAGGMNLSVGAIGVCVVMAAGWMMQVWAIPASLAGLFALGLGGLLGWLNGMAISKSGVSSFVVTLASANLFSGAMLILTRAKPLNGLLPLCRRLWKGPSGGLALTSLSVAVVVGAALAIFYRYSVVGRQILAAGANARAAGMSGIPVGRRIVSWRATRCRACLRALRASLRSPGSALPCRRWVATAGCCPPSSGRSSAVLRSPAAPSRSSARCSAPRSPPRSAVGCLSWALGTSGSICSWASSCSSPSCCSAAAARSLLLRIG